MEAGITLDDGGKPASGDDYSDIPFLWMKICDPHAEMPTVPAGVDVRVLIPRGERFAGLATELRTRGVPFRTVGYLMEQERISSMSAGGLTATVGRYGSGSSSRVLVDAAAAAARDGFDMMWHEHSPDLMAVPDSVPASGLVPAEWIPFLPHTTLNPAQAEAIPHITGTDEHLMVVAPTGSGKTVIGMAAALRTVLGLGRKAAWLVPQRSLTNELDHELAGWRERGLSVERLSGEYRVDAERIRAADLWVTTTEKFEAICRTASLRTALAEVGCLIVDEIHLIGDPVRGSFLEAILTRVQSGDWPIRIIGLSATVANAEQISHWLRARMVRVAWRPTHLTWQLPMVSSNSDWSLTESAKARLASNIVGMVTGDGGSVLVFCGSKRAVRRMGLIVAASRGANVFDIDPDNAEQVQGICRASGIGLHYKDWEYKAVAERDFRSRAIDVLIATSTLAAGVNLPARAVVVADTEVGMKPIDVATVQQMFGRAGRLGAGERAGWAFLIVDEAERELWQQRLLSGFRVNSQMATDPAEHVLAEAAQRRIGSRSDAQQWWSRTLSYHQGDRNPALIGDAVSALTDAGFLAFRRPGGDDDAFDVTDVGMLTTRLMVSPEVCRRIRATLSSVDEPESADDAERVIIQVLATHVPKLAAAAISEDLKGRAVELKLAGGVPSDGNGGAVPSGTGSAAYAPGDLACAVMLAVANSPGTFDRVTRHIGGIPYALMYPVFDEAPRYLQWLAGQGFLGTARPWIAIVAADLGRRIRWHRCQPFRGAGRLLWMCEQMAAPVSADQVVPVLWHAARQRGHVSPDWLETGRPRTCRLSASDYAMLLRDRATGVAIERTDDGSIVTVPGPAVIVVNHGAGYRVLRAVAGRTPIAGSGTGEFGIAVFTRRGDYYATGWLGEYTEPDPPGETTGMPVRPGVAAPVR